MYFELNITKEKKSNNVVLLYIVVMVMTTQRKFLRITIYIRVAKWTTMADVHSRRVKNRSEGTRLDKAIIRFAFKAQSASSLINNVIARYKRKNRVYTWFLLNDRLCLPELTSKFRVLRDLRHDERPSYAENLRKDIRSDVKTSRSRGILMRTKI